MTAVACSRCRQDAATPCEWLDDKWRRWIASFRRSYGTPLCDECGYDLAEPETTLPSYDDLVNGAELITEGELVSMCGWYAIEVNGVVVTRMTLSDRQLAYVTKTLRMGDAHVRAWPEAQWLYERHVAIRVAARIIDSLLYLYELPRDERAQARSDISPHVYRDKLKAAAAAASWTDGRLHAALALFDCSATRDDVLLPEAEQCRRPVVAHIDFLLALESVRAGHIAEAEETVSPVVYLARESLVYAGLA